MFGPMRGRFSIQARDLSTTVGGGGELRLLITNRRASLVLPRTIDHMHRPNPFTMSPIAICCLGFSGLQGVDIFRRDGNSQSLCNVAFFAAPPAEGRCVPG